MLVRRAYVVVGMLLIARAAFPNHRFGDDREWNGGAKA
jgi:hypothetical protein